MADEAKRYFREVTRKGRQQREAADNADDDEEVSDGEDLEEAEVATTSHEPGFGIVDSGCAKGVVGADTLAAHESVAASRSMKVRWLKEWKPMRFRYGNSTCDESIGLVEIMGIIQGKTLYLRLHVVPGAVPLLISKPILKELGGILNFQEDTLELTKIGAKVQLLTGPSGHYQLDLLGLGALKSAEVGFSQDALQSSVEPNPVFP
jgi:hypothetical protein